jgi:AbrB family looped-hinge helix DNA binding protein
MSTGTTPHIVTSPLATVVTRKGQVTIPAPIRDALGIKQGDTVSFQLAGDSVTVKPIASTLAEGYQSIPSLKNPLSWNEIEEIAQDEQVEAYVQKNA